MKRMGNILLILLLFIAEVGFSQKNIADFNRIIEAEAKAAHKIINYKANINTSNYDVTYHRFDWTVDPAVAFISGIVTTSFTAKDDLTTITFDLTDNMTVSAVTQNGNSIPYTQNSKS